MLHTKFRGNRPVGSGDEDFCVFYRNVTVSDILGLMESESEI